MVTIGEQKLELGKAFYGTCSSWRRDSQFSSVSEVERGDSRVGLPQLEGRNEVEQIEVGKAPLNKGNRIAAGPQQSK